MMRLLKAETTRLVSRRGAWVGLLIAFVLVGGVLALTALELRPPVVNEQQAEQFYQEQLRYWERNHERDEKECRESGQPPEGCVFPKPEREDFIPKPMTHADALGIATTGAAFLGFMTCAMVAGSLVGAEFRSGSIATQLTYVPRRTAVFGAKAIVATVAGLAIGVVLLSAAVLGETLLVTALQGADKLVADWTLPLFAAGRGVLMCGMGALLGAVLGFVFRNSLGVTASVLGYAFATIFLGLFSGMAWFGQNVVRWLPETNLNAFLNDGTSWSVFIEKPGPRGPEMEVQELVLSLGEASAYWVVLLAVAGVLAWVLFKRRDVQ